MNGFLCIDKPENCTSFDVIRTLKRVYKTRKCGHTGTLDPLATGLLLVCFGDYTKLIPLVPSSPKTYTFVIQFGLTTTTLDREGEPLNEGQPIPTKDEIFSILPHFTGIISQRPPLYSAVKINGQRAYKKARNGEEFTIAEKDIEIFDLNLLDYDHKSGRAHCTVTCSAGTYVRSLAGDIGKALGTAAYADKIRRVAIHSIDLTQAHSLDTITAETPLLTAHDLLTTVPSVIINGEQKQDLSFGRDIYLPHDDALFFVYDKENNFVAIVENVSFQRYHPKKVFIQP